MRLNNWGIFKRELFNIVKKDAFPEFRWEHLKRVYVLCSTIKNDFETIDMSVIYTSVLLHDIGTYLSHRPKDVKYLQDWDHVAYAETYFDKLYVKYDINELWYEKVRDSIHNHLLERTPKTNEGIILRDADLLDSTGIIGSTRILYKIGDIVDRRFNKLNDGINWLIKHHSLVKNAIHTSTGKVIFKMKEVNFQDFLNAVIQESNISKF